jgi:hypothetical protein
LARLIEDSCRYEQAGRIADMPTFIERLDLARTVNRNRPIGAAKSGAQGADRSGEDAATQVPDSQRNPTDSPNESNA